MLFTYVEDNGTLLKNLTFSWNQDPNSLHDKSRDIHFNRASLFPSKDIAAEPNGTLSLFPFEDIAVDPNMVIKLVTTLTYKRHLDQMV